MRIVKLLLILSLFSNISRADDTELVHLAAHAGMGYLIHNISYNVFHKTLGMDKTSSLILSFGIALGANLAYKAVEQADSVEVSTLQTGLGAGLSTASIVVFDF